VSDPGRHTADAGLSEAVRPFRRAASELSAPAAGLEVALGALEALTAGLDSPLGQLDVSPFASVLLGAAGAAVAAVSEAPAAARARRPVAPKQPEPARGAGFPSAPAGEGLGIARALEQFEREMAVRAAAESVVPGSGPAAAGIARGVAGLTSLPIIGELAQTALDAIPQPPLGAAAGRSGRPAGQAKPGSATGLFGLTPGAGSLFAGVSAAPASGGDGLGGISRALREFQKDVAVSRTAESLVPGTGPIAVPVARGVRAAATLLEQLAETALDAVAPHTEAPKAAASGRTPRSDARDAVRRELDAAAARPERPAPAMPARTVGPRDGASPAHDGARAAEPPDSAELAWVVNEALVEQARRHGVDLS
jgi:hypothetical protein